MHVKKLLIWLTYTVAVAISTSLAFSIGTTTPYILTTEQKELLRIKVLHESSASNNGELPPQQLNGSHGYQSEPQQTHQCLIIPEHRKKTVDLVFLFEGSESMTEEEFNKNKDFIKNIIDSLKNSSIKFAAVQFSSYPRLVFDFNDYVAGTALDKLQKEPHMRQLTNTHKALTFVLNDLLENPAAGASADATKVLVLITEGTPSDTDRRNIIGQYQDKNIIRLVIAVRSTRLDRFTSIALKPTKDFGFQIENYDGLTGILENIQITIRRMEDESTPIKIKKFGLSVVDGPTRGPPTVKYTDLDQVCAGPTPVNSVCYKMEDDPQQFSSLLSKVFLECRKRTMDFVFLFDGSESMTEEEFNKNKDFIKEIIDLLKNSSIKFAAVQFSSYPRLVFDFNDYVAGTALDKLQKEPHMRKLTNTHKALTFVLNDLLENPAAGASADATKGLVLITDGNPSDTDRRNIIGQYQDKNIIRLVIAVRGPRLDRFTAIASKPTKDFGFQIENYDGLTGILENILIRIFRMKGIKVTGDKNNKTPQSIFSAVVINDTALAVLGSVRSNNWCGLLQRIYAREKNQSKDPGLNPAFYIENSVSVGKRNNIHLHFTGAPQFEQKGQVVLYTHDCENWIPVQRLNGDRMGSYFGAELCSVDIDSDGNTDFLLVGAPMFWNHPKEKREGQIYVYTLTDEIELRRERIVAASAKGRFGTTISSIADLNGDGLRDVAVGAPLEDENRGAVYIYLGDKQSGMRSTFSQKIMGQQILPGLRYFGLSIDGDIDHEVDGLPHIVIGSLDTTVVLRSRPVFNILPQLYIQPEEIRIGKDGCLVNTDERVLTLCFKRVETTESKAGVGSVGLNISYDLDVDPKRQTRRGFFSQTNEASRHTATLEIGHEDTCRRFSIHIPSCVEDTSSPIRITLNFFQVDKDSASGVLDVDSVREAVVEIPFQKQS
ncbi:integrin alpha-M-like [Betta splendens]|uniref:Integrin alpha-M-like n=1 Tax=Betta splendens TaxID=158456 RepID=A0A6P7MC21_BETSP|nr:integrin alpha-M-like [Betta splendens]